MNRILLKQLWLYIIKSVCIKCIIDSLVIWITINFLGIQFLIIFSFTGSVNILVPNVLLHLLFI